MKRFALVLCLLVLAAPLMAQSVPVTYQWEASAPSSTPVAGYNLYVCPSSALTGCAKHDAGNNLTFNVSMTSGSYWVYVTAYGYAVTADNPDGPYQSGELIESDKSNTVPTRVHVPPGNPKNFKVQVR